MESKKPVSVTKCGCQGPILINDVEALRKRLLGKGEPGRLYSQVREVVRYPEMGYPLWRFLCHVVDPGSVPKSDMGGELEALAARGSWHEQYMLDVHTWIAAAALGRLAIYLDWTLELGKLPARKCRKLAADMLAVMDKAILPVLRQRVPSDLRADQMAPLPNQGVALFFAAAAVGAVFGHRRGASRPARRLAQEALERYQHFISHSRPDGYDGEGPTYQLNVQASAMGLTCAILEELTGQNLFEQNFGNTGLTLRRWFETTCFGLLSESGMMRPFDDYGYGFPTSILGFAYAAGRSGDARFLTPVRRYGLWHAHQSLWDTDDRTLSLVFWPETGDSKAQKQVRLLPSSFARMSTDTGPKLDIVATWKACERLPHTHAHTDPGNIIVECNEIPLVLDGRPSIVSGAPMRGAPYCRLFAGTNTDYFVPYRFGEADVRDQGAAALGPHNTVMIDDVQDLDLSDPVGGQLIAWEETDDFTRLVVDVAAPYRSRFDLESFLREVTLYRTGVCVVRDRLVARTSHEFKWRLHVRPEVTTVPDGWDVRTAEGIRMLVRVAGKSRLETKRMEAYPSAFEGHCTRLQICQNGRKARFDAAFCAEDLREELADITDGWRFIGDARLEGFEKGWPSGEFKGKGPLSLSLMPSLAGHPECTGLHVWLARRMPDLTGGAGSPIYLEMRPPLSPMRVWLDGQPVPIQHGCWDKLPPLQIPLGSAREVNGRRLVILLRDLPTTRPPGPMRLIRVRKPTDREFRLIRRPDGSLLVGLGDWERVLAKDVSGEKPRSRKS